MVIPEFTEVREPPQVASSSTRIDTQETVSRLSRVTNTSDCMVHPARTQISPRNLPRSTSSEPALSKAERGKL